MLANGNSCTYILFSFFKLPSKEFVPAATHSNAAKETTTPVVSALVGTAEVTINKQNRESPAKSRKREPQVTKETKEPTVVIEKKEEVKITKDDSKTKEPASPPVPTLIVCSKEIKEASNQREEKKTLKKEKVEPQKSSVPSSPEVAPDHITLQSPLSLSAQENCK